MARASVMGRTEGEITAFLGEARSSTEIVRFFRGAGCKVGGALHVPLLSSLESAGYLVYHADYSGRRELYKLVEAEKKERTE